MANISILHHITLPFHSQLPRRADFLFALVLLEVREGVHLGSDEAFFEVGVDHSGGLWRGGADRDRPGSDFLFAGREVTLKAERALGFASQRGKGGFG